jgi:hypothetical protein
MYNRRMGTPSTTRNACVSAGCVPVSLERWRADQPYKDFSAELTSSTYS